MQPGYVPGIISVLQVLQSVGSRSQHFVDDEGIFPRVVRACASSPSESGGAQGRRPGGCGSGVGSTGRWRGKKYLVPSLPQGRQGRNQRRPFISEQRGSTTTDKQRHLNRPTDVLLLTTVRSTNYTN